VLCISGGERGMLSREVRQVNLITRGEEGTNTCTQGRVNTH